jgi:hypothetical protein
MVVGVVVNVVNYSYLFNFYQYMDIKIRCCFINVWYLWMF